MCRLRSSQPDSGPVTCTIASASVPPVHEIIVSTVAALLADAELPPGIPAPIRLADHVENADEVPFPMMIGFWIAYTPGFEMNAFSPSGPRVESAVLIAV